MIESKKNNRIKLKFGYVVRKNNNKFSHKYQYLKIMFIYNKEIFFISLLHIILKEVFLIPIPILETITTFLLIVTYCESCMKENDGCNFWLMSGM